jgi:hypothetical protein
VNITKPTFSKWRPSRFVEVTDNKEISKIKINSVPETQKICVKILKQLFVSGPVIIALAFLNNHLAFGE